MSKVKMQQQPELRFLRDDGSDFPDWKFVKLKAVAKRQIKKNKDQVITRVLTNSAVDGIVDQRDYFDKDIAVQGNLDGYFIVENGDYVYNPRISIAAPVGPISRNNIEKGVMSPLYSVFRFNTGNSEFYAQFFKSSKWHNYLRTVSNSGARHDRMSISNDDFMAMPVPKPDEDEQQKIADCLASIDTLLTNQSQALKALKEHKKGLMQQLFPAEGETVPKLRFPEFKDKGHWKKEVLGKLGELVSGLTYSPDDVREQGLLVLRSSNVQNGQIALGDNVYVRTDIKGANISKANDILICVRNGSKALIGKNALIPEGLQHCTHGAFMTVFRAKNPKFVYQLFQTNCYERQVSADLGATINSINGKQFVRYEFLIPTDENEQTKIANFLFSVDDLIATQNKKIETLKVYKKGLMQQLFPDMSELA